MFRPPTDKPPPDVRDDDEKAEVARILARLPEGHPALEAFERGVDTISLTHLVGDPELSRLLSEAYLCGWRRLLNRTRHFQG